MDLPFVLGLLVALALVLQAGGWLLLVLQALLACFERGQRTDEK